MPSIPQPPTQPQEPVNHNPSNLNPKQSYKHPPPTTANPTNQVKLPKLPNNPPTPEPNNPNTNPTQQPNNNQGTEGKGSDGSAGEWKDILKKMREGGATKNQAKSVRKQVPSSGSPAHMKGLKLTGTKRRGQVPTCNDTGQRKLTNFLELKKQAQIGSIQTNGRGKLPTKTAADISVLGRKATTTEAEILMGQQRHS